ncbi:MAG: hypothetical protein AAF490_30675 [Chloroflexota bacterium]
MIAIRKFKLIIIFMSIGMSLYACKPQTQSFSSNTLGLSFEYPNSWHLGDDNQDNTLNLEYEVDRLVEARIYIQVDDLQSKNYTLLDYYNEKNPFAQISNSQFTYSMIQAPEIIDEYQYETLFTSGVFEGQFEIGGVPLLSVDYIETLVMKSSNKIILIGISYRGMEADPKIANSVRSIVDSIIITDP